ncbi:MAG: LTA synthase family protein [Intestinimonas sp.]|jgi:phosphoglycerol transferase MdoB-like AlkP superfamily enzyme|nr:LTA synthase family protein [Intestinimonas sp.]
MKRFFLFQLEMDPAWPFHKKMVFWLWNFSILLIASLCVGILSLAFSPVANRMAMLCSYLKNPWLAFLNLAPVVVLAFLLYFVVRRPGLAYGLTCGIVASLTAANWFKLQFRDDPLMFEDLKLIRETKNMMGRYHIYWTRSLAVGLALLLLGGLFTHFFVRGRMRRCTPGRLIGFSVLFVMALFIRDFCYNAEIYDYKTANNDLINQWSATEVYSSKGFVYPFLHSIQTGVDKPPDGYDEKQAQMILSAYPSADIPENKKVSLITVMLESYSDFSNFNIPGLSDKVYADYHALEAESYTGNLISNVFAGGTVNTERCYLTGYSNLGSFRAKTNSYPWYFRSQGYTVEGAHPCYEWFYNRSNINVNLGFENYYFVENYFSPLTGGDVGYDDLFFPELIKLWEKNKQTGKPYFSYDLTYQGHGPYNTDCTWWGDDYVTGGNYSTASRNILNNYFGSIYNTNQNLTDFFDYYRKETDPVIIVLFGDHKPWLGDGNSVYKELGINLDLSTQDGFFNYYTTRYLIWANDAAKEVLGNDFIGEGPDMGSYFLMNQVFRLAGWVGPSYMQATQQVMDAVPIIHTTGVFVENGVVTTKLTPEAQALLQDYNTVQYYDRKHCIY